MHLCKPLTAAGALQRTSARLCLRACAVSGPAPCPGWVARPTCCVAHVGNHGWLRVPRQLAVVRLRVKVPRLDRPQQRLALVLRRRSGAGAGASGDARDKGRPGPWGVHHRGCSISQCFHSSTGRRQAMARAPLQGRRRTCLLAQQPLAALLTAPRLARHSPSVKHQPYCPERAPRAQPSAP